MMSGLIMKFDNDNDDELVETHLLIAQVLTEVLTTHCRVNGVSTAALPGPD